MNNNMKSATNEYRRQKILTASPSELTLMLYNECIKHIKIAVECINQKQFEKANKSVLKAQDIIAELSATLNMSFSVSNQMSKLYEFIQSKLVEGNINKNNNALNEALELVVEFRDTWYQMMKINENEVRKSVV